MLTYIARRVATSIMVVVGVSIAIFLMLHVIYPSPAIDVLGPHANKFSIALEPPARLRPAVVVQYLQYMNQLLHGNLGYSYKLNQSVTALFRDALARSAYLSGVTLVLAVSSRSRSASTRPSGATRSATTS